MWCPELGDKSQASSLKIKPILSKLERALPLLAFAGFHNRFLNASTMQTAPVKFAPQEVSYERHTDQAESQIMQAKGKEGWGRIIGISFLTVLAVIVVAIF